MLPSNYLISPVLSLEALLIAGDSHTYNYYFHDSEGYIEIASGTPLVQSIYTLTPPQYLLDHAQAQFHKISDRVNINFVEVFDPSLADISFYWDLEIELNDSDAITYGLTLTNYSQSPKREWFEIFFNAPQLENRSRDFNSYVFNHELLHSLGFEHTFDDSDGDFYLSIDPLQSATPEETTMSYRLPSSGIYPSDISAADYSALTEIWGPRMSEPQEIYRLYNVTSGLHFFTSNLEEIDILTGYSSINNSSSPDFINEGVAYVVSSGANQDLYRFYDSSKQRHFYSANSDERDFLMTSDQFSSFIYEGIAFKVFSSLDDTANISRIPVFRFYDPVSNFHFYTANDQERLIWEQSNQGWINEGIAWYA